jgi:hypothetical protein
MRDACLPLRAVQHTCKSGDVHTESVLLLPLGEHSDVVHGRERRLATAVRGVRERKRVRTAPHRQHHECRQVAHRDG